DWKRTLGGEWRQYEQTFPLLARSRIGGVSLECAAARVPISLIGLLGDKDILLGAVDVGSDTVATPGQVAAVSRQGPNHGARSPTPPTGLLGDKALLPGAVDAASDTVETPAQVAAVIREGLKHAAPQR